MVKRRPLAFRYKISKVIFEALVIHELRKDAAREPA
jgi:hypothetical protein